MRSGGPADRAAHGPWTTAGRYRALMSRRTSAATLTQLAPELCNVVLEDAHGVGHEAKLGGKLCHSVVKGLLKSYFKIRE